jgi:hypothetical protein
MEAGSGNDDGIIATSNVLCDPEQPATGVFLEREDVVLSLNLNLPDLSESSRTGGLDALGDHSDDWVKGRGVGLYGG